jgi:hypothetical protein
LVFARERVGRREQHTQADLYQVDAGDAEQDVAGEDDAAFEESVGEIEQGDVSAVFGTRYDAFNIVGLVDERFASARWMVEAVPIPVRRSCSSPATRARTDSS